MLAAMNTLRGLAMTIGVLKLWTPMVQVDCTTWRLPEQVVTSDVPRMPPIFPKCSVPLP